MPTTAAAIYMSLEELGRGNKQRMGTLFRAKQACDSFVSNGKDFTLRDIEDYCRNTFGKGPNAQSISNDKFLRAYIDARRGEIGLKRKKSRSSLSSDIEEINDIDLRIRMRLLVEDHQQTQKRLRILTEALSKLIPPLDLDLILTGKNRVSLIEKIEPHASLDNMQLRALQRLVNILKNEEQIRRMGLDVDMGDVISRGLRETFIDAGDIQLLRKLLLVIGQDTNNEK